MHDGRRDNYKLWATIKSPVAGLRVRDVVPRQQHETVTIESTQSIEDALQLLGRHGFLSLPVVGDGVIDTLDLALLAVAIFSSVAKLSDEIAVNKFFETTIGDAVDACLEYRLESNPVFDARGSVAVDAPLADLLDMMWGGWHRVQLTAGEKTVRHVSQSDVLRFMASNLHLVAATREISTAVRLLPRGILVTARTTDTALAALSKLPRHAVSAVPVVDDRGRLVGVFSASDLRHLDRANIRDLGLPVLDFIATHAPKNRHFRTLLQRQPTDDDNDDVVEPPQAPPLPYVCKPTDAFDLVLYKILALKVHRLFVVDDAFSPIGVVSMGDLMRIFLLGNAAENAQRATIEE
ncbi:hypothetical protein CTAYLR_008638 [Chrysophaeum taylorii]|uniref:CBS domain-containing protein n=1 Tax=Chrysophaeum taylorii TaxID=2483200 RepID=A0AAD7UJQ6_9STRA|nr:hypothetical protein CTAYLR_008638 [Chrysophaeum taylorii]